RRECPTGVDMAKMKIEFLHHYRSRHGVPARERLVAELPRYAPWVSRIPGLANARNRSSALRALGDRWLGLSTERQLPQWAGRPFFAGQAHTGEARHGELVLLVDTFNRYFEPDVASDAVTVLTSAGYRVHFPSSEASQARPLCCGRTYLAAGMLDKAKEEARRTIASLKPFVAAGMPIVGLEPSCLFTLKDEFPSMLEGATVKPLAERAVMFEQFLVDEGSKGFSELSLESPTGQKAFVHGHCHQKAFNAHGAVHQVLSRISGLEVNAIPAGCCGMAGAFGYQSETQEVSVKMAELDLLPAIRKTDSADWLVADGFSCRHQIADLTQRKGRHVAQVLAGLISDSSNY
ncbi:MAG: FAD-binding oxidoreductase, partial [Acidiferrobacter sp.]|nr:FAD-binding oxidoreductase [Acidiferrobacter sp.]